MHYGGDYGKVEKTEKMLYTMIYNNRLGGEVLAKLRERFICGLVHSIAGITLLQRVRDFQQLLKDRSDVELLILTKKVRFFSGRQRSVIDKALPVLYDYIFVRTTLAKESLVELFEEMDVSIDLLGNFLPASEVSWLRTRQSNANKVLDLHRLGADKIKKGTFVRVVNGPYTGMLGTVVKVRGRTYTLSLSGIELQASKSNIRKLEYEGQDDDYSCFIDRIR